MSLRCAAFLSVLALAGSTQSSTPKPHILWVISDDLGWDDVGFRGAQIRTPVIDGLASGGMVLNNYYLQPSCSPSRATFLSGRYPLRHGVNTFIAPIYSYGMPLNETTVAQLLRKRGYRAHAIGKWHVGMHKYAYTPTFRGFESFYGYYGGGEDYFLHTNGNAYDLRRDVREFCGRDCSHIAVEDSGSYSTHLFTSEAVRVIDAHDASTPLFMYLAYQAVHAPELAPQSYIDAYSTSIQDMKRRKFAAMLSAMDEGIGNVTAALDAKGMLEQTFIIFTTDNGGPSETCGRTATSNYPLRGSKCSLWEGGTRGIALVNGAGVSKTGTEFQGLMHAADWLPTLLDMVGAPVESNETLPLDGISQWKHLQSGSGSARDHLYYGVTDLQVGNFGPALQVNDLKLIVGRTGGEPGQWPPPATLREPEVQLGKPPLPNRTFPQLDNNTYLLFNLSSDADEHTDIADDHPEIVQDLLGRIKAMTHTIGCMDCDEGSCPDPVESQITIALPDGTLTKAWEPHCDRTAAAPAMPLFL